MGKEFSRSGSSRKSSGSGNHFGHVVYVVPVADIAKFVNGRHFLPLLVRPSARKRVGHSVPNRELEEIAMHCATDEVCGVVVMVVDFGELSKLAVLE